MFVRSVFIGFVAMQREKFGVRTPYASDETSMAVNQYKSVFFVCRKPKEPSCQ